MARHQFQAKVIQRYMDEKEFMKFEEEYAANCQTQRKSWRPNKDDWELFKNADVTNAQRVWGISAGSCLLRFGRMHQFKKLGTYTQISNARIAKNKE